MPPIEPPRIDLRLLRQFVAVAEEMHFTRAAERLNMSQPSLSAAIRRLEEEVGAILVERGRKAVRLTAAGAVLLVEARRLLAASESLLAATRDAAEGRSGAVRLGYVGSAMYGRLPQTLRGFRRSHPDVSIVLREMTTAAQMAALREDDLDLAIVVPPLEGAAGLEAAAFDEDRLAIALPTSHALARSTHVTLHALASEDFICWPREQGPGFHDQVMRLCADAHFTPAVIQEAHGMHAVLSLVAADIGVAIVPHSMKTVRPDEIAFHPIDGDAARFDLVLCRRTTGTARPAVARLETALRR